ncbi:S-adenosylmethionine:tRNA ribosyltransferase-isomerase [Cecembia calidifontis]|jgi:S-adenosylmethionine:tRNA ribosyltransferase-isomerase|uniref:S-adenosylmethionine:tRNA ribosyltransferase-isomerase n=1 Tax=Cecembia calidifontis TaxID=1187080 RepID=A0A4Q7PEE6_9BACT|nr:S-adenosylmethionine:tRNA ribosyltransferase-isomerase [Cecembia calidifontis]RZS97212.1 S-adenosylmethionine:tRNA ribosyltransferase-isomerase [Cecembia calidifontis]
MFKISSIEEIRLSDYEYNLPDERIAKFPLEKRDHSKLLQFSDGRISHHRFFELPELLPTGSLMAFNNTKVIPARLIFQRETGAKVEIFLLKPVAPSTIINEVMIRTDEVSWETMIGNLKKWKDGEELHGQIEIQGQPVVISAKLMDREKKVVSFSWTGENIPFVSIVEASGEVPLPPYLNREATEEDRPRYQTVYSKKEGAVAAPTAGLHFTDEVLENLEKKGVNKEFLTLHVSAGTFQPIKSEKVTDHAMHSEQVVIELSTLERLAAHPEKIIAVGTTSMRTLESLYWYGVRLIKEGDKQFFIPKLYPYEHEGYLLPGRTESFKAVLDLMNKNNLKEITGSTEIFIMPGYDFQVCDALITNFHQPSSTLILLVAAFTDGNWRQIYEEALNQDYRFLSYGDSSLLWRR